MSRQRIDYNTLPRKRCENCPKFFRCTKPNRRFCSDHCRLQFHANKNSWGKLRDTLTKQWDKQSTAAAKNALTTAAGDPEFRASLAAAGFIHRSQLRPIIERIREIEKRLPIKS